jgi:hypothetical protein
MLSTLNKTNIFTIGVILDDLSHVVAEGFDALQIQRKPHLALLSTKFYQ